MAKLRTIALLDFPPHRRRDKRTVNVGLQRVICIASAFCIATALAWGATTFNTLASFDGTDGDSPQNVSLAQGFNGDFYGTTYTGGANTEGAIFKITSSGKLTTVDSFDKTDGDVPYAGLLQATSGDLYGTTYSGGANGEGTVFRVTAQGKLTTLYNFCAQASCTDGARPIAPLIQATNGDFYGTTVYGGTSNHGTVFNINSKGTLTTLHSFADYPDDGAFPNGGLVQATNGDFYGTTYEGGTYNNGTVFKITAAGKLTILHNFKNTDGIYPLAGLIQATNGDLYGTTEEGGANVEYGTVFKITSEGTLTTLYSFDKSDGADPNAPLIQATDGNLYGTTVGGGDNDEGTVFKINLEGKLTTLHSFCAQASCPDGDTPIGGLLQATNGTLYGTTSVGGANGEGTVFSISTGLKEFVTLLSTSGTVGSTVGILGQGFSSSSVVKFNGVEATEIVLTGSTYIAATVPTGASNGYVTVTTGTTTLTSAQKYTVHNSWSAGTAMPVAVTESAAGAISGKIYVVSGIEAQGGAPVNNNQVYNPSTNAWTTAAVIPTPVQYASAAVVNGLLYVFGGYEGSSGTPSTLVQIYDPATNAWTTGAAMPTARGETAAVVDGTSIYVIGGNGSTLRLTTVEKYVPSTNTWTEEAPLSTGVSDVAGGLLGSTIVAADGYTTSGDLGTTEGYDVSTNTWSSLTSDPNPRNSSCYGVVSGLLYVATGIYASPSITEALTVNESFRATTNEWTSLAAIPTAAFGPGSAVDNGQLYCFGGEASFQGTVINNVQIYQP